MLSLEDIDMNVDYDSLCLLESHLMHDLKRKGKEVFVKEYSEALDNFKKDWSHRDFCYLLALLGYLDETFDYDKAIKLDKFILNPYDFDAFSNFGATLDFDELFNIALVSFRNRGFIFDEIGEAI